MAENAAPPKSAAWRICNDCPPRYATASEIFHLRKHKTEIVVKESDECVQRHDNTKIEVCTEMCFSAVVCCPSVSYSQLIKMISMMDYPIAFVCGAWWTLWERDLIMPQHTKPYYILVLYHTTLYQIISLRHTTHHAIPHILRPRKLASF